MKAAALVIAALFLFGCATPPAAVGDGTDDVFPAFDVISGKRLSRSDCDRLANAVWTETRPSVCIRFFPSTGVTGANRVAFWISGDRLKGRSTVESYEDNSAEKQTALANLFADRTGIAWVVVGRPGIYGSSGDHNDRRTPREIAQIDSALTLIRNRLGVELQ